MEEILKADEVRDHARQAQLVLSSRFRASSLLGLAAAIAATGLAFSHSQLTQVGAVLFALLMGVVGGAVSRALETTTSLQRVRRYMTLLDRIKDVKPHRMAALADSLNANRQMRTIVERVDRSFDAAVVDHEAATLRLRHAAEGRLEEVRSFYEGVRHRVGFNLKFFTNGVLEGLGTDGTDQRGVVREWTTLCWIDFEDSPDLCRFSRLRPGGSFVDPSCLLVSRADVPVEGGPIRELWVDCWFEEVEHLCGPAALEAWRNRVHTSRCWAAIEVEFTADELAKRVTERAFQALITCRAGGFELPNSETTNDFVEALRNWYDYAERLLDPQLVTDARVSAGRRRSAAQSSLVVDQMKRQHVA